MTLTRCGPVDLWGTPVQGTTQYCLVFTHAAYGDGGRDEHYKLTYGDFCIYSTPDGFKYVEFNEKDTKTRSGETNASRQFKPKMWNTPNNISRCPLHIFEKFLQKRPVEMCQSESPFYLAVNYNYSNDDIWYKKQKMGKDRINTMAGCKCWSLGGKQIIQLKKQWLHVLPSVPETQIIQLTGHKIYKV